MTLLAKANQTIALLATDRQHSIQQHVLEAGRPAFVYTCYGFEAVGNSMGALLGFDGYPRTPLFDSYFLGRGHRIYNPQLMRFISADSLSPFDAGGTNAYAYCAGDPVNYRDDSGQSRNLRDQLHKDALLKNPLQYHPDWKNYPTLSKDAKRHIGKLTSRIEKAKKFAKHVDDHPDHHLSMDTSNSWRRFERNKNKIAKSFDKLEKARFDYAVEFVQRGLPLPDWGTAGDQSSMDPPHRNVAETIDPPPGYADRPSYDEAMGMIRTAL
ncbi:RHS repeat-associated core domain-containing protein [Pseudomonas xantholysinigenes]|uniref:RHS repeat-associated core domain-containing protein n=1 Tax=Pseudomonas xantholysinigenes TaxID=2745490 RepID=UPI001CEE07D0|nr:RHS repeat-associated core domain-containing protein [Pseudomonas xantholysinigenes]